MSNSPIPKQELLKAVLEPLLEDFEYWFTRAHNLLESERILFLSVEEQADLLERVKIREKEVKTAKILFKTMGEKVGIDTSVLIHWHSLVAQCWQVSMKWRSYSENTPPFSGS
ncbi:DUF2605 domain-containing protein [Aphanothece sacrum]|uniref:DUF2605 domain-containing protein n=1 Tax=Aphanothece sacrum FPU1 TaxID=1920663 RepID=A0A401IFB0_APHSA|nr:DUF2605 domain-containing protein [Aphanothece sacrum]GBF79982.1 hypothetical protein AsFPU1_1382 [Aphanothece sacrum FPU1]GBF83798.1 hypothetical protein AsFPU3_0842 [Aphanothece sacrum FPU3]